MVERVVYTHLTGVRFLVGVLGYSRDYVVDNPRYPRNRRSRPVHFGTEVTHIGV